jgi:hypothetical protein
MARPWRIRYAGAMYHVVTVRGNARRRVFHASDDYERFLEMYHRYKPCCRYCRVSQRAVGAHVGYRGDGAVLKQRQRLREMAGSDAVLRNRIRLIECILRQI